MNFPLQRIKITLKKSVPTKSVSLFEFVRITDSKILSLDCMCCIDRHYIPSSLLVGFYVISK